MKTHRKKQDPPDCAQNISKRRNSLSGISFTSHFAVSVIVPPSPYDGSQFLSFYFRTYLRVIDDFLDFLAKGKEVFLRGGTPKLAIMLN